MKNISLVSLVSLIMLAGCGGDTPSDSPEQVEQPVSSQPTPSEPTPSDSAMINNVHTVPLNELSYIALNSLMISKDFENSEIASISVKQGLGDAANECNEVQISDDKQGINVELTSTAACHLSIGILAIDDSDQVNTLAVESLVIASNDNSPTLVPLSLTIAADSIPPEYLVIVDLYDAQNDEPPNIHYPSGSTDGVNEWLEYANYSYPAGFELANTVIVEGQGQAIGRTNSTRIDFTPDTQQTGYTRLTYLLEDTDAGNSHYGTIDITVVGAANSAPTQASTSTNFCYPMQSAAIVANSHCVPEAKSGFAKGEVVRFAETVTIDVASYFADADSDTLSLSSANSSSANVALVNNEPTKFTFTANSSGQHYVSVQVKDANGGFENAVITVNVGEPLFTQINSYYDVALALDTQGQVWFLGTNQNNNAGFQNNKLNQQAIFYRTWTKTELRNIVQISTTHNGSSFALDQQGVLWVVGSNTYGELGVGHKDPVMRWTSTEFSFKTQINAQLDALSGTEAGYKFVNIKRIVGGVFTASALVNVANEAGDTRTLLFATGKNGYGQLGKGSIVDQYSWQLAKITKADVDEEAPIDTYNVLDVSIASSHSLAVVQYGNSPYYVVATGSNKGGQLGLSCDALATKYGEAVCTTDSPSNALKTYYPVFSSEHELNVYVSTGTIIPQYTHDYDYSSSYILDSQGDVYVAGANNQCQLLFDSDFTNLTDNVYTFTRANKYLADGSKLGAVKKLNARGMFVYLKSEDDGQVYVAGNNGASQLGVVIRTSSPNRTCVLLPVPDSEKFDLIAPGWKHGIIASTSKHQLRATGKTDYKAEDGAGNITTNKVLTYQLEQFYSGSPLVDAVSACNEQATLESDASCIRVLALTETETPTLLTAPISYSASLALGYSIDKSDNNAGLTFSNFVTDDRTDTSETDNKYRDYKAQFVQTGKDATVDGEGGQLDRFCKNLGKLNFYGRNDWRRATFAELTGVTAATDGFNEGNEIWTSDFTDGDIGPSVYPVPAAGGESPSRLARESNNDKRGVCISVPNT